MSTQKMLSGSNERFVLSPKNNFSKLFSTSFESFVTAGASAMNTQVVPMTRLLLLLLRRQYRITRPAIKTSLSA